VQVINVQDPRASGFHYNPKWQELQIVSGVSLALNKKTLKFEVDRTPGDEEELVPIQGLSVAHDASGMTFNVEYEGDGVQFNLASKFRFDHVLYAAVNAIHAQSFSFDSDEDSVSVSGRNGALYSFIVRNVRDPSEPYMRLAFREDGLFNIIYIPHEKQPVSDLGFEDHTLILNVEGRKRSYTFASQGLILALIKDLLACWR